MNSRASATVGLQIHMCPDAVVCHVPISFCLFVLLVNVVMLLSLLILFRPNRPGTRKIWPHEIAVPSVCPPPIVTEMKLLRYVIRSTVINLLTTTDSFITASGHRPSRRCLLHIATNIGGRNRINLRICKSTIFATLASIAIVIYG